MQVTPFAYFRAPIGQIHPEKSDVKGISNQAPGIWTICKSLILPAKLAEVGSMDRSARPRLVCAALRHRAERLGCSLSLLLRRFVPCSGHTQKPKVAIAYSHTPQPAPTPRRRPAKRDLCHHERTGAGVLSRVCVFHVKKCHARKSIVNGNGFNFLQRSRGPRDHHPLPGAQLVPNRLALTLDYRKIRGLAWREFPKMGGRGGVT